MPPGPEAALVQPGLTRTMAEMLPHTDVPQHFVRKQYQNSQYEMMDYKKKKTKATLKSLPEFTYFSFWVQNLLRHR